MITVPQRLKESPFVDCFCATPDYWLMKKQLQESLLDRQSYLSMHALSMVVQGTQKIRFYNGTAVTIPTGRMVILRRGIYTVSDLIDAGKGFQAFLIYFTDDLLQTTLPTMKIMPDQLATSTWKADDYFSTFWDSIMSLQSKSPNTAYYESKVREFFAVFQTLHPDATAALSNLLQPSTQSLTNFMEQHFDKPLTVEDYAYLTGRSESTFRREFKLKFGTSPRKWIIQKRLEKAHQLLVQSKIDVTAVAYEVGYENVSHFISAFKNQFGSTPGQLFRQ